MIELDRLDFEKGNGLVTVVVQDSSTLDVLLVAHADREALERTLDTGELHLRSRSRGLWRKGATSGNTMRVEDLFADCDSDAVLVRVVPAGPACHTGAVTCFGDMVPRPFMPRLDAIVASRAAEPSHDGYTRRLLDDRNLRLKKLGEEAAELAVACADGDRNRVVGEAADLTYHMLVALRAAGASWSDVERALESRAG